MNYTPYNQSGNSGMGVPEYIPRMIPSNTYTQPQQQNMYTQQQNMYTQPQQHGQINLFEKNILIFSNYCIHSKNFIEMLEKHPNVYTNFKKLCVDVDKYTNKRNPLFYEIQRLLQKRITDVPTVIIENGEYVLSGKQAFMYLINLVEPPQQKNSISGFNKDEMNNFSDKYTLFDESGSNQKGFNEDKYNSTTIHDASHQNYKFLNENSDKIFTPPEEESHKYATTDYNKIISEREQIDNQMQNQMQNKKVNFQDNFNINPRSGGGNLRNERENINIPRQQVDFEKSDFGWGGKVDMKQSEMKFSDLEKQREQDLKLNNVQRPHYKVNFQTGEVIPE